MRPWRLQDRVQILDQLEGTPCLRFLGKEDHVSDCCGEKLEERFVAAALKEACDKIGWRPTFSLLAPERSDGRYAYVLYCEASTNARLTDALETLLCKNFHYQYCRRLGQLGPLRIQWLPNGSGARYLRQRAAQGRRLGSIKALALDPQLSAGGLFE